MSPSLSPRRKATVLPSLPPSPSLLDEVFSHRHSWNVRFGDSPDSHSSAGSYSTKGKGKRTSEYEYEQGDDEDPQPMTKHEAYPPMTDQAAETQRVEETLRRWELAERQRRKSQRESVHHAATPSLISNVTRTATLALSRRSASMSAPMSASIGPTSARAFKPHDAVDVAREGYAVPLDEIDPASVPVHSPSPSVREQNTSIDAGTASDNPFVHPSDTPIPTSTRRPFTPPSPSPFADARGQGTERKRSAGGRDPPRPLEDRSRVAPLQPTSQPALRPSRDDPEERREVRWWHDWLCGCSEGPDRGGDNQAGRTNPFE